MDVTITAIRQFILAGKAFFTVQNKVTGGRFTYKVAKVEDKDLWFVSVLTGSDNEGSYTYMGIINDKGFVKTQKSKITEDAVSFKGFRWLWNLVTNKVELPENVEFYHAGRCARCGRKLTTPESVEAGYGPTCIGIIGG